MHTTIKPSFFNTATLYADKVSLQAYAAWLITALIVLVGFRFAREAASALLMNLYELFIQKNADGL